VIGASLSLLMLTGTAARSDDTVETIVFIRHGEKPDKGLGQLNCKGLNRALALPSVIAKLFGRPSVIFAPDPSDRKVDDGEPYDYVRPLATIEPTAISLGLPVNASIGVSKMDQLQVALEQPLNRNGLIPAPMPTRVPGRCGGSSSIAPAGADDLITGSALTWRIGRRVGALSREEPPPASRSVFNYQVAPGPTRVCAKSRPVDSTSSTSPARLASQPVGSGRL
jgi:hypothetical protein